MKLSGQMFDEITDSITVVSRDEMQEHDRRSPRVRLASHLAVSLWSDPAAPLSVRVRDLSEGGVGIYHSHRIGLDEQLVIRFPRPGNRSALVLGKVVYWEPLSESLYGIGVQFERMVDEDDLQSQSQASIRQQMKEIGVMSRLTNAFARTWRVAS